MKHILVCVACTFVMTAHASTPPIKGIFKKKAKVTVVNENTNCYELTKKCVKKK